MMAVREKQMNAESAVTAEEQMRNEQIEKGTKETGSPPREAGFAPLFDADETERLRKYWLDIQRQFVDDPDVAVKGADELVTRVIENIMGNFRDNRASLEKQWRDGDEISTEDLRLTLKRYRSFFDRLLSLDS
jgi:hypothetical protein